MSDLGKVIEAVERRRDKAAVNLYKQIVGSYGRAYFDGAHSEICELLDQLRALRERSEPPPQTPKGE